jgi:hypothetical protein
MSADVEAVPAELEPGVGLGVCERDITRQRTAPRGAPQIIRTRARVACGRGSNDREGNDNVRRYPRQVRLDDP